MWAEFVNAWDSIVDDYELEQKIARAKHAKRD